jgi:hypothetical protein
MNSFIPVIDALIQVRIGSGSGGSGGGRFSGIRGTISSLTAPGNELLLAIVVILLIALAVLTALTIREYILLKKKKPQ